MLTKVLQHTLRMNLARNWYWQRSSHWLSIALQERNKQVSFHIFLKEQPPEQFQL
uniref:Alpha-1,2-mannosyltransferase ALG9 n=1 Tax=Arundo donax TaxID=35708 RepID=A0A0A8YFX7_ARUDO